MFESSNHLQLDHGWPDIQQNCQDLNGLDTALDSTPAAFALDLAMLAGRSSILNLQGWLQQKVSTQGVAFCQVHLPLSL